MLRNISATLSAMFHHFWTICPSPWEIPSCVFLVQCSELQKLLFKDFWTPSFYAWSTFLQAREFRNVEVLRASYPQIWVKTTALFRRLFLKSQRHSSLPSSCTSSHWFRAEGQRLPRAFKKLFSGTLLLPPKTGLFANATSLMQIGPSHAGLGAYMVCLQVHCRA